MPSIYPADSTFRGRFSWGIIYIDSFPLLLLSLPFTMQHVFTVIISPGGKIVSSLIRSLILCSMSGCRGGDIDLGKKSSMNE